MRLADVLDHWQLVRGDPDQYAHPNELADLWSDAPLTAPTTVASVAGTADVDDFDWWLRCSFAAIELTSVEFRGLTYPAEVYLDGHHVADCESMFLPVRIECEPGPHEVCVRFGSLNKWLTTRRPRGRWRSGLVGAPGLRWARTTLLGRAPVYGNVPAPVGFWRPIIASPGGHTSFTIVTTPGSGAVEVRGSTHAPDGSEVEVGLRGQGGDEMSIHRTRCTGGVFAVHARVDDPQSWWPRGYGGQPLYEATVRVNGREVGRRSFGFRTVSVSTEDAGFRIDVNGVPIFCRGVTWAPPDASALHVDEAVMRRHVQTFADAGVNIVRVVGGLVYEQDEFWRCCAELGVMVWQDAMLATFDPPEALSELVARELERVLDDVSGNPALVVVSGGSETLQQPEMLGMAAADATMEVLESWLPQAVARHSDAVYVRSSPSAPVGSGDLAIRPDTGVAHWFGVGGYLRPIPDVRSAAVKFAAECLAFANPPTAAAVERHFGSAAVAGHHPQWKAAVPRDRGASWDFEDVRDFYARAVFGEDLLAVRRVDPERYLQLGRLAIAEAMRDCFAFWRRGDSGCSGALVLSGKDTCPGAGWGLLDVDGTPKAALDVLARVWAPVAVVLGDDGLAGIRLDVHNDAPTPLTGRLTLTATSATGPPAVDVVREMTVPAHASSTYADAELSGVFRDLNDVYRFGPPTADAVEASLCLDRTGHVVRDVLVINPRTDQPPAVLEAVATRHDDQSWDLRVSSQVALRYASVDVPGWVASDNLFHLAPGRPYDVRLTRADDVVTLAGTVSSIDLLAGVPIVIAS